MPARWWVSFLIPRTFTGSSSRNGSKDLHAPRSQSHAAAGEADRGGYSASVSAMEGPRRPVRADRGASTAGVGRVAATAGPESGDRRPRHEDQRLSGRARTDRLDRKGTSL